MCFTVLRSKAVSRYICDKQHQPPLVNYMPTTRQWEIQNSVFRTPVHCFLSRLFKGSKKKHGSSNRELSYIEMI